MSRRGVTLLVSFVLIVVLGAVGLAFKVPYVLLTPGPTTNTLGTLKINGKETPLIQISGHQTYNQDTKGHLNFTTVSYSGGPGSRPLLITALRGWLSDSTAVVPEESIFPKNTSTKQVEQENTQEMTNSQQNAIAAALTEAGIPLQQHATVASVQKGLPADGRLKPGDEIVAVDGKTTAGADAVTAELHKRKAGDTVALTIKRSGAQQQVSVTLVPSPADKSKAIMGITVGTTFTFPFSVKISVGDVGGPSAGLMFSLGIYEKLTPTDLTGGRFIAGTGTITPDGQVGPIGGIQQKMIAARDAGASIFLTPPGNCAEALKARPGGLTLVKATTMDSAVKSLQTYRANPKAALPACTASTK